MTKDDMELVGDYAATQSEAAFAELVSRHLRLVYSSALRQVRNPELAEEVTQAVFSILARKAGSLGSKTVVAGWLHRTTRYVAANALQAEFRRLRREREACMNALAQAESSDQTWRQISPLLDEALTRLAGKERDALILRYFEDKSLVEVGAALGIEERAAQKRVSRALEKLRRFFARRGLTLTVAALAGAMTANSVQAAPAFLTTATVTAAAAVKGVSASASTATLIKGTIKLMAWTKLKTTVVVCAAVLLTAGTGAVFIQKIRHSSAGILWAVKHQSLDHEPAIVFIRPAQSAPPGQNNNPPAAWGGTAQPAQAPPSAVVRNGNGASGGRGSNFTIQVIPMGGGGGGGGPAGGGRAGGGMARGIGGSDNFSDRLWPGGGMTTKDNKMLAMGADFLTLLMFAYDFNGPPDHVILPADLPTDKYDVLVGLPQGGREELQKQLQEKFGLTARREQRDQDSLALRVKTPGSPGLKPHDGTRGSASSSSSPTEMKTSAQGVRMAMLVRQFSNQLHQPVVDQTGLRGTFDFDLAVPVPVTIESASQALQEQLGLELVPADKESVEYLIVEKNR